TALTSNGLDAGIFPCTASACSSTPRNVLITSPLVAKIAGASRFRASVSSHAFSNGSEDFIACAEPVVRVGSALLSKDENRYSSRLLGARCGGRVGGGVSHPFHASIY